MIYFVLNVIDTWQSAGAQCVKIYKSNFCYEKHILNRAHIFFSYQKFNSINKIKIVYTYKYAMKKKSATMANLVKLE